MNDIEKAIKHFKNVKEGNLVVLDNFKKEIETKKVIGNSNVHYSTSVYENRDMYYSVAIEALEKQIARPVTDEGRNIPKDTAYCPCCGAYLSIFHKYCFWCGQKLLQSEVE